MFCNFYLETNINRTMHIRHQCRKTTVLSCHRCLINTGVLQQYLLPYRNKLKWFTRLNSNGWLPTLLPNIRVRRNLVNTLACYDTAKITAVKSFTVRAPGDLTPSNYYHFCRCLELLRPQLQSSAVEQCVSQEQMPLAKPAK
jgi:hypothetical protein